MILLKLFFTFAHAQTLSWSAPPPRPGMTIVGYRLYYGIIEPDNCPAEGMKLVHSVEAKNTSYKIDDVFQAGKTYQFNITAYNSTGESAPGNNVVCLTLPGTPDAPTMEDPGSAPVPTTIEPETTNVYPGQIIPGQRSLTGVRKNEKISIANGYLPFVRHQFAGNPSQAGMELPAKSGSSADGIRPILPRPGSGVTREETRHGVTYADYRSGAERLYSSDQPSGLDGRSYGEDHRDSLPDREWADRRVRPLAGSNVSDTSDETGRAEGPKNYSAIKLIVLICISLALGSLIVVIWSDK